MIFNISKKLLNIGFFVLFLILGSILLVRLKGHFGNNTALSATLTYALTFLIIFTSLIQLIINLVAKEEIENTVIEEDVNAAGQVKKEVTEKVKEIAEDKTGKKTAAQIKETLNNIVPNKLPSVEEYGETLLINMSKEFGIVQGILHTLNLSENKFFPTSFYAYFSETKPEPFKTGETLPGQAARNMEILLMDNIPENYIQVISGLGESTPNYLLLIPVIKDDAAIAVIEVASFIKYDEDQLNILKELGNKVSTTLNSYVKGTEKTKDGKEQTK